MRLVGIDHLSGGDIEAHVALVRAGTAILEGLDLRAVEPGRCFMVALPLIIPRCDGAPARAVLWRLQG